MKPKLIKPILILLILLLLLTNSHSQDIYPTTIGEMTTEIVLSGSGVISNLKEGEEVKFQTLTFQETAYQKILSIEEELIINGVKIKPSYSYDEFDNKYVNFNIKQNGNFDYQIKATIKRTSIIYELNDYNIEEPEKKIMDYITNSEKIESNSTEIMTLTNNKLTKKSFLETINKTIFWVNDYVEYAKGEDFKKYYLLQKSAIETLLDKKGVCDEFANLAASMLRVKKIPTKVVIGVTFDGSEWGNHAWIEIYHKDLGWIPSDPTFREAGFVDATHIKLGAFKDITQSLAKATYPTTANVTFQTQTLPEVTIINTNYFNQVQIESKTDEIKTNQWNDIILEIKNQTNGNITVPITIKENYKDILIQETSQSVTLKPSEKSEITFKVYPSITLTSNEIAKGTLTFNSLSSPYEKEITIKLGNKTDNGKIVINDITPIATQKEIMLDITATNYTSKETAIDINIKNDEKEYFWNEKILPFTKQNFRKIIENTQTEQSVIIETLTERYEQVLYPVLQKIDIAPEDHKETVVTQKISEKETNIVQEITENPQIILFALLPAVAIIIFGLFLTKKQYI